MANRPDLRVQPHLTEGMILHVFLLTAVMESQARDMLYLSACFMPSLRGLSFCVVWDPPTGRQRQGGRETGHMNHRAGSMPAQHPSL